MWPSISRTWGLNHSARFPFLSIKLAGNEYCTFSEEALQDLSGFEMIWVISHMHLNKGWKGKVRPPRLPEQRKGLFSTRSPHRPNPVALSSMRVTRVDSAEGVIYVQGLDLLDGELNNETKETYVMGGRTERPQHVNDEYISTHLMNEYHRCRKRVLSMLVVTLYMYCRTYVDLHAYFGNSAERKEPSITCTVHLTVRLFDWLSLLQQKITETLVATPRFLRRMNDICAFAAFARTGPRFL